MNNTLLEAEQFNEGICAEGKRAFKAVDDVKLFFCRQEKHLESLANPAPESTLAKMITRLTDITDGALKFQGKDTKLKQSQLRDVYGNIHSWFFRIRQVPLTREELWGMESRELFEIAA